MRVDRRGTRELLSVQLEQLHGRRQWRTVWVARVRRDGAGVRHVNPFTGAVRPTAKGVNIFRAVFVGDDANGLNLVPSSTRPFTITGT